MSSEGDRPEDDWDDDDLLEEPEPILVEDEGPPRPEEDLDDDDLLSEDQPPQWGAGWTEQGDEPDADGVLDDDAALLDDDAGDWVMEGWAEETPPTTPPRPAPPAIKPKPSAPLPAPPAEVRTPNEPLVVGYRLVVDLPELGLQGVAARAATGQPRSALQAPVMERHPSHVVVSLGHQAVRLPLTRTEDASVVDVVLRVGDREAHALLPVEPAITARVVLGRDLLAALYLQVDVRRADS